MVFGVALLQMGWFRIEVDSEDALCLWLKEAVDNFKPKEWTTDQVKTFKHDILGLHDMEKKMVIRECYTQMQSHIVTWLNGIFNPPLKEGEERMTPGGLLIVTGTPGIGKSVFLAYMAVILIAEGYNIVIQRGNTWTSYINGKATAYGKTEPLGLLEQSTTVQLFDPLAGGKFELDARARGCSIVFTSPHGGSYKVAYKQKLHKPKVLFMPIWSKPEVLRHKTILFLQILDEIAEETAKQMIEDAYDLLGGSVRWLFQLLQDGGDLSQTARGMIQKCIENCTYEDLRKAVVREPQNVQGEGKQSQLSLLLQIKSVKPYDRGEVMLIESPVAHESIREKLDLQGREARQQFVNACLEYKELGSFVGNLFQEDVLTGLTSGIVRTLTVRSLKTKETDNVDVPTASLNLMLIENLPKNFEPYSLRTDVLYVSESKNFPATDFFFAQKQDDGFGVWLLQITKGKKHEFKLESMHQKFQRYFAEPDLKKVLAIKWIIVTPSKATAEAYTAEKTPQGQWKQNGKVVAPEQYVSWGKWTD